MADTNLVVWRRDAFPGSSIRGIVRGKSYPVEAEDGDNIKVNGLWFARAFFTEASSHGK